jgi:hypothetical protein
MVWIWLEVKTSWHKWYFAKTYIHKESLKGPSRNPRRFLFLHKPYVNFYHFQPPNFYLPLCKGPWKIDCVKFWWKNVGSIIKKLRWTGNLHRVLVKVKFQKIICRDYTPWPTNFCRELIIVFLIHRKITVTKFQAVFSRIGVLKIMYIMLKNYISYPK